MRHFCNGLKLRRADLERGSASHIGQSGLVPDSLCQNLGGTT